MEGRQKWIVDRLEYIIEKLQSGYYGSGDDIDEDALWEDLDEVSMGD